PRSTYLAGAVISVIYMGTIILEVMRVVPITFPHTISNLTRVVTLNVICFYGLAAMSSVVTRLYREMLYNRTHAEEIAEQRTVELRESHAELERTTARLTALQHLSEALRRARGLKATLRTVVEEMGRSGFSSVIIDLVDEERHNLVTRAVSVDRLYERAQRLLKVPLSGLSVSLEETANITVRVAHSGEIESTDDIREVIVGVKPEIDPALAQAAMRLVGVESVTVFPLWAEEEVVGVVSVYHPQGKLSLEDVNLMQAVADQVGLAIKSAQAFEGLQTSNRRLATLQRITATLQSTLPLEEVLRTVVQGAVESLNYVGSSILMPDQRTEKLIVKTVWGGRFLEVLSKTLKISLETFSLPLSAEENPIVKAYLKEEVQTTHGVPESFFIGLTPLPGTRTAWALKQATGAETSISIPLRAGQTVVGVLLAFSPRPRIDEDERATLLALADQAGLAIENARLFAETISERAKLSAVITGTEDAIMVTDETDHILLLNPAARRAFEIVEEGWVGQPLAEVVENQALHDLFARLSVKGTTQNAEIPVDARTFYANLAPISGIGKVLAMQDITYLKELDEMKSDFVATVSHDLRSPLSIIEGYIDLLKKVGPLNAQQSQFVGKIKSATGNMTELITDLLDLGKIEAGLEMEMTPCDLEYIIDLVITGLQGWAERKGIELRVELPENIPTVQGNSTRLCQALTNLVDNALKYTPSGETVTIGLVVENGSVTVCVKDTGIGIGPDDLPHIFDKFYRVEREETRDIAGTGLGLAIAKSVVEMQNGRIWAESEPGAGSTFSFTLPVLEGS
ncbi:MAG: ATP-binding protein, partial [Anaerolineae bacterium]|nr:ATP-binding protein [Anaerolineae bacterium]